MTTYFSLQALSLLPNRKIDITCYNKILQKCKLASSEGCIEDWLSCHALLRSLAFSDSSRTSAAVRREARKDWVKLTWLRGSLRKSLAD